MENNAKQQYEAPTVQFFDVTGNSIICTSVDRNDYPGFELE